MRVCECVIMLFRNVCVCVYVRVLSCVCLGCVCTGECV